MKAKLWQQGYLHFKNRVNTDILNLIRDEATEIFERQFKRLGLVCGLESEVNLLSELKKLYAIEPQTLFNCGKQIQHLISLHKLGVDNDLVADLIELGLSNPVISTRPVLYFNHRDISATEEYWKTPPHQDWRSMQSSLDALVVWVPLVDISKKLGALEIVPGSHKQGLLSLDDSQIQQSFGTVDCYKDSDFVPIETKAGDVLVFSAFMVHRSGENSDNRLRWSCHFRYNNLDETTFIDRGFPHAYIYKPIEKLIQPFETKLAMEKLINENTTN